MDKDTPLTKKGNAEASSSESAEELPFSENEDIDTPTRADLLAVIKKGLYWCNVGGSCWRKNDEIAVGTLFKLLATWAESDDIPGIRTFGDRTACKVLVDGGIEAFDRRLQDLSKDLDCYIGDIPLTNGGSYRTIVFRWNRIVCPDSLADKISLRWGPCDEDAEKVFRSGCDDLREKALELGKQVALADGCENEKEADRVKAARMLTYALSIMLCRFCPVCADSIVGARDVGDKIKHLGDFYVEERYGHCLICGRGFWYG